MSYTVAKGNQRVRVRDQMRRRPAGEVLRGGGGTCGAETGHRGYGGSGGARPRRRWLAMSLWREDPSRGTGGAARGGDFFGERGALMFVPPPRR